MFTVIADIIIPSIQREKIRHKEVKKLAYNHTAHKWQIWIENKAIRLQSSEWNKTFYHPSFTAILSASHLTAGDLSL